jgi:beta-lactamase regulating signal transducer with metallopeptidase domain
MSTFLQSPWLKDLGWVLVHSLWQGAVLWALLALVFALGRAHLSAAVKHRMAWLTLTLLALAPAVTMTWMQMGKHEEPQSAQTAYTSANATPAASAAPIPSSTSPAKSNSIATLPITPVARPTDAFAIEASSTSWLAQLPIWFATAWLAGLTLLIIRLLFGWRWIAGLKRTGAEPEPTWRTQFLEWSGRTTLRHVRVLVCPTLGVPLVVGWLRPVICFPASLLTRLSVAEVEALMLHELAHLKRRDPLLQFWVTVVETLLFHNPAAHVLANTVRHTGELACDDLVLAWKGDGKTYARALAAAAEWRGAQFALAATGIGSLKHRIQRILGLGEHGRLTSLPERFGITSVAGIALYFVVCGLAVPRIARALTPEERISVINQEREALKVPVGEDESRKFKAAGIVRMADGSKPTNTFALVTWSYKNTSFSSGIRAEQKKTVEGHGNQLQVGAWIPGYAPAITSAVFPEAETGRGTFELVVERGFPAILKFVDKAGKPIPDAIVSCITYLMPGRDLTYQGKLTTDANGTCSPGNMAAGQSLKVEVRAFGYQWQYFDEVQFEAGKPATLTLLPAAPVSGTLVDAHTQWPVSGALATCLERQRDRKSSYHYGYSPGPRMSAAPSDQSGRLQLDICHPDDTYEIIIEAPGYARKMVGVSANKGDFHAILNPELVFSGVLEDPEKKLYRRNGGKVSLQLETWLGEQRQQVWLSGEFEADAQGRTPFSFHNLSPGKLTLHTGQGSGWETDLQSSLQDVVFRTEDKGLKVIQGPDSIVKPSPPPVRSVEIVFAPPSGSPAFDGEVTLSISGQMDASYKVTANRCTVDAPIGKHMEVQDAGTVGYRFDTKRIKVEAGEGPVHVDVPMEEAGAISGDLHYSTTQPLGRSNSHIVLMKWDPRDGSWNLVHDHSNKLIRILGDGARYFISPVALDTTYRVIVQNGLSFAESPEFQISNSTPLHRQDITFPVGTRVQGTVLQPDGSPMEGGMIYLLYREPNYRHTSTNYTVKPDGTFELPGVNFGVTGQYFLSIPGSRGVAPLIAPLDKSSGIVRLQREAAHTMDFQLVDAGGAPVTGVKLRFAPKTLEDSAYFLGGGGDSITSDSSDDLGRIRVTSFPPGEYGMYIDWDYEFDVPGPTVNIPAATGTVRKLVIKKWQPKP